MTLSKAMRTLQRYFTRPCPKNVQRKPLFLKVQPGSASGCVIRTLMPMNSIVFLAANCLIMYATIPLISVLPAMTLNTAEANMQKHGVRITGMTNASNSFVGKLGGGVGGSLIGWVLGAGVSL